MSFSKSHLFDPADQLTSGFARILSHPVRVDMLRLLANTDSSTVENLSSHYPLAKSTISQHLEIFRKADVFYYKEEYPYIIYSLNHKTFDKLNAHFLKFCQSF